jgi:hypothetical protein
MSDMFIDYSKKLKCDLTKKQSKNKLKNRVDNNYQITNDLNTIDSIINESSMQQFLNNDDDKLTDSLTFIQSPITLSNWIEELSDGDCMGLAFNISTNHLSKLGIIGDLNILSTLTFMPVLDFLEYTIQYLETKSLKNVNFKSIINGNAIGEINVVIPLYINEYHWKIANMYMKPMLGIILGNDPFAYDKSYHSLLFIILSSMLQQTLISDYKINNKWTNTLLIYMRTCRQHCIDSKYNKGINNFVNLIINDPKSRIKNFKITFQRIFGQCISIGHKLNNHQVSKLIQYFIEEEIRDYLYKAGYTSNYINFLQHESDDTKQELLECCDIILNKINDSVKLSLSFIFANKIFNRSIIKDLDNNYGILDDKSVEKLNDEIIKYKINNATIQDIYSALNLEYNINNILCMIIQGSEQSSNKIRMISIINDTFVDLTEQSNVDHLIEKFDI